MSAYPRTYVIGIDGGGSWTRCLLADESGNPLAEAAEDSSALYRTPFADASSALKKGILAAISSRPLEDGVIEAVCAGIAGAASDSAQRMIRGAIMEALREAANRCTGVSVAASFDPDKNILIFGDARIALFAGADAFHGVVAVSGTGSVVYGETLDGRKARAGGWGPLLSFEGSGYDIGQKALRAVMKSHDGRGPSTVLGRTILAEWGMGSPMELFRRQDEAATDLAKVAGACRLVDEAARAGDAVARDILREAAGELARGVAAVVRALNFGGEPFPLILSGGVLSHSDIVYGELIALVKSSSPEARVKRLSPAEPAAGAMRLALRILPKG
jgi:N-acetylglucosamine kinase-like BadF-type ATPase